MRIICQKSEKEAGELTQWLRAFVAQVEDLGSIPITHVVTHDYL